MKAGNSGDVDDAAWKHESRWRRGGQVRVRNGDAMRNGNDAANDEHERCGRCAAV
jgi:hypothetical protein